MVLKAGEASVHILGYHIDISNERLLTKMHEMRHARELRLQKILQKIAALGSMSRCPNVILTTEQSDVPMWLKL